MSERAKSFLHAWIGASLETSQDKPIPDLVAACKADAAKKDIAREELDNAAGGDLAQLIAVSMRGERHRA